MNPKQKAVLDDATSKQLKKEKVLTGGNKYINPKHKKQPKKKKSFFEKLFS